jgi:hypothetical protein
MSAKNGDKSRHNINRRRAIARRAKLHAEVVDPNAPKRPAKAKTTAPKAAE